MSRNRPATLVHTLVAAVAALAGPVVAPARGDDEKPPFKPLLIVRTMPWDELATHPEATVRGVVVRSRPRTLVIQGPTGGLYINISQAIQRGWLPGTLEPGAVPVGQEVEIEGCLAPGGYAPIMVPRTIRLLGPKPLPEPTQKDPVVLLTGGYDSELVEFTGIVQAVEERGSYWVMAVSCRDQEVTVAVDRDCIGGAVSKLVDAEVRFRGVVATNFSPRGEFRSAVIYVEQPDWVTVVEPSPRAVLAAERMPLSDVGRFRAWGKTSHLLRTAGTVIHSDPGKAVFIQDGPWGIRVETNAPTRWEPGDEVEVSGFLDGRLPVAGINHATVRRVAEGEPPEPYAITPEDVLEVNRRAAERYVRAEPGDYDGCLVRFPARLVETRTLADDRQFVLDAAGSTVLATLAGEAADRLGQVLPGSELLVTGVLTLEWDPLGRIRIGDWPRAVSLRLRSPADIVVTRPPSPWTPARLAGLLAATAVGLGLVAGWAWLLKRQREQLEVMVAQRTSELAEARRQEQQSEERQRQLLEHKLKTSLTASAVAHEINQPLSRLLLKCQLEAERKQDAEAGFIDAVVADAERVVTTIEKMKVLLRNVETSHGPVDLGQLVTSALIQVKRLVASQGVVVRRVGPESGCVVDGDDVQLQFALSNLLRNAVEAIAAGGGSRREIEVGLRSDEAGVWLTVGDSGPGWPGGSLDDVLLSSSKPEGTGIGLFVVRTAVENHDGSLAVGESWLGGAEFQIWLPQRSRPTDAVG